MRHAPQAPQNLRVDMLNPLKSTLKNSFPEKDGWKLYNRYNWSTKVYDYVLQKEVNNTTYRILVEINLGDQVDQNDFEKLAALSSRLGSGDVEMLRTVMVVHDKIDMATVPAGIEIMEMSQLIRNGILNFGTGMDAKLVA